MADAQEKELQSPPSPDRKGEQKVSESEPEVSTQNQYQPSFVETVELTYSYLEKHL
jgi:hypothetical protein